MVIDRAIDALSRIGKEGLLPLMEMVADQHGQHRWRAASVIGSMNNYQPGIVYESVRTYADSTVETVSCL